MGNIMATAPSVAVLARRQDHQNLSVSFPNAEFLAPGNPKVGYRFDRIIVAMEPEDQREHVWVEDWKMALPPRNKLEYLTDDKSSFVIEPQQK